MNTRYQGVIIGALLLAATTATAVEWSTNLPSFRGGSYDGWSRQAMTTAVGLSAQVSLSSGMIQTFVWTQAEGELATLTIRADNPLGTITNGGTLRVSVPADWQCRFNTDAVLTFGSNAVSKVNTATLSYSVGGRTLQIAVTNDFVAGDTLTVSGLRLLDLALCRAGSQKLELDFNGDGARDMDDTHALTVSVEHSGGSYDGWDRYIMTESASLKPAASGTIVTFR